MKFSVFLILTLLCACSSKPKVVDAGLSEESFLSLHYKVLYDFFGGQGFDKANLTPHSHQQMKVNDMKEVFAPDDIDLANALFINCNDKEEIKISLLAKDNMSNAQTRMLNDTETKALDILLSKKAGYAGYQEKDSGLNSFMWPIHSMNEKCVACHGGEKGDLLGAIIYQFPNNAKN